MGWSLITTSSNFKSVRHPVRLRRLCQRPTLALPQTDAPCRLVASDHPENGEAFIAHVFTTSQQAERAVIAPQRG